ncbi:dnaK protein [Trichomonas vaginalis G3]|uniref:DnaK protein n=1 Tax=Trichomonas vaginalis (strain ATCC PRA-98 / G3) TaxID=412133 RepID=A2F6W8_TRIV3|nr:ATP binding [Trichomonas vaginalis G3]EAX99329.1 dnaK protein [Trichomonas vaginalis G3]KAI5538981.1 ATP binding [Trichomonas vaginalis G3]|eukprot:XP_001312259.1 dnaK protein [Trichomonas vaginalis G3]
MLFLFSLFVSSTIVAIDIGSEHMAIAAISQGKHVEIIMNQFSKRLTPSIISLQSNLPLSAEYSESVDRKIGVYAIPQLERNSSSVIRNFPQTIGRICDEKLDTLLKNRWYDFQFINNRVNGLETHISLAMMIEEALIFAQEQLNIPKINDIVITIPSYFSDSQRTQYLAAAKLLGLNVLQIYDEKVSFATFYSVEKTSSFRNTPKTVGFLDFGAGKLSFSGMKFTQSGTKTVVDDLEYYWNEEIGGIDFDVAIAKAIKQKYHIENDSYQLLTTAQKVKHLLTLSDEANVSSDATSERIIFTRSEMNEAVQPILEKIDKFIDQVKLEYDSIELLGGATRIPAFIEHVEKKIGNTSRTLNSDEALVTGAAYAAGLQTKIFHSQPVVFHKKLPYDVILSLPDKNITLFKKGILMSKVKSAKFDVVNKFSLIYASPIPLGASKVLATWDIIIDDTVSRQMKALIKFKFDDNGILVIAESKVAKITNGNAYINTLTLKLVDTPFDDSDYANDMNKAFIAALTSYTKKNRIIAKAKNDFESLLYDVKNGLAGDYLKCMRQDEKDALERVFKVCENWAKSVANATETEYNEYRTKLNELAQPIKKRFQIRESLKEAITLLRSTIKEADKASKNCEIRQEIKQTTSFLKEWIKTKLENIPPEGPSFTVEDVEQKRYLLQSLMSSCQNKEL